MIGVRLPCGLVIIIGLITPRRPTLARATPEQFNKRPRRTRFDNVILFVGFSRMLALARREQINLPPPRRERARILAAHAEQNQLGDIAKIEADAATIRAAILAHLMPDDIGFVGEAPRLHDRDAIRQHRIWAPQIQM